MSEEGMYVLIFRPIHKAKKKKTASFRIALKPHLLFRSDPHKIHHFSNTVLYWPPRAYVTILSPSRSPAGPNPRVKCLFVKVSSFIFNFDYDEY